MTDSPKETKSDIPDKVITAESISPHLLAETTSFKADKVEENAAKITDEKSKNRKKPIIIGLCAIVLLQLERLDLPNIIVIKKGKRCKLLKAVRVI